jgi:D-sedoheptulose 7-phosphate isomerase
MATDPVLSAIIQRRIEGSIAALAALREHAASLDLACRAMRRALLGGGTVYTAGNGGSAAQALHLAEELIGRYRSDRPPLRAVCLNADPTALTCIANDFGFEQIFARQCAALCGRGDALVAFTTSGRSRNIVEALRVARDRGAVTIGLLGGNGGACLGLCDHAILVPSHDSAHVQEAHQVVLHLLCETVEERGSAQ